MGVESIISSCTAPTIPGADLNPKLPQDRLPVGSCDTHAHLFGPEVKYPYHIARSYTPPDATSAQYKAMLKTMGFTRAVLIQPSVYGTDNRLMLDYLLQAQADPDIEWRAVAVVDSTVTEQELLHMHHLGVRGVRVNLVFPGGIAFEEVIQLGHRIAPLGWHIQLLIDVSTFEHLEQRITQLPVPVVIDHMGHLATSKGIENPGFQVLLKLVKQGCVWVKLTGSNRITQLESAPFYDVDVFFLSLLEANANRCLFGTDWPHVQIPTPIPNDGDLVDEFLRLVPDEARRWQILVHNPAHLYGF